MRQAVTRVEDDQYERFKETAARIGTTPAAALKMFIYAFNEANGFPYPVRSAADPAPAASAFSRLRATASSAPEVTDAEIEAEIRAVRSTRGALA